MNIMRSLRRRPEREFTTNQVSWIRLPVCDTGMSFYWCVIITLIKEPVFTHIVRFCKTCLNVTKLVGDGLVYIADTRLVVDLDLWMGQGFIDTHERRQNLIFYMDKLDGLIENIGIYGGNGGNRIANIAHLANSQRVFILAGG